MNSMIVEQRRLEIRDSPRINADIGAKKRQRPGLTDQRRSKVGKLSDECVIGRLMAFHWVNGRFRIRHWRKANDRSRPCLRWPAVQNCCQFETVGAVAID